MSTIETTIMCMHEWHEDNQPADDFHHCTRDPPITPARTSAAGARISADKGKLMSTTTDFDRIAELHAAGKSAPEIALAVGCTSRTVQRWRQRTGNTLAPRRDPYPDSVRQQAARLIADGCNIQETARTVGVDPNTIKRWMPDAPRMTRIERSQWAAYCKHHRDVLS